MKIDGTNKTTDAISQFNGQLLKIQNISYNIFVNNIFIYYKI